MRNLLSLRLMLAASVLAGVSAVSAQEIIAHRGASHDAPENTLPAMELAWEQGADAIELDIWLSSDGKLIVFHDADTKRFEPVKRKITDLTLEQARALDVGVWKGEKFKGVHVPDLGPILASVPKGKRAVLELKDAPRVVPEVAREVKASGRTAAEVCVISFNAETLKASKAALPELPHYFLKSYKKDPTTGKMPEIAPLIAEAKAAGFDGLNLSSDWPWDAAFVKTVKDAGLKIMVWTVDDDVLARRLKAAGVDAITTNRPAWLREKLK